MANIDKLFAAAMTEVKAAKKPKTEWSAVKKNRIGFSMPYTTVQKRKYETPYGIVHVTLVVGSIRPEDDRFEMPEWLIQSDSFHLDDIGFAKNFDEAKAEVENKISTAAKRHYWKQIP
jgi:hypothetical protein